MGCRLADHWSKSVRAVKMRARVCVCVIVQFFFIYNDTTMYCGTPGARRGNEVEWDIDVPHYP